MKKIKGYVPCFSGFYNSIWEGDDDLLEININEDREEKGFDTIELYNDITPDLNYQEFMKDTGKSYSAEIEKQLKELNFINSLLFENIYSPREYNFATDSIDCIYSLTDLNIENILIYLNENRKEFYTYIKDKFSNCSGFVSFYSNNCQDWIDYIKGGEYKKPAVYFSEIFQFILLNEDKETEMHIYGDMESVYLDQYVNNWDELINFVVDKK